MTSPEIRNEDLERLEILYAGLQGLVVGPPDTSSFEDRLDYLATHAPFGRVFAEIAECRKLIRNSKPDYVDDAMDWEREHPGLPVDIQNGEEVMHGRILTVDRSIGDQVTLEGIAIADDELIPVYVLPFPRTCIRVTSQLDRLT